MSLFSLPKFVKIRLERIQRGFLWGGGALEKKPHLVNWSNVCLAKKKGVLGIKDLTNLNRALLSKWSWRFANERDSLWRSIIGTNFGEEEGDWCTRDSKGPYDTGLLKEIRKEWEILRPRVGFIVGNGRRVQFWKDAWCREVALCTLFPSLFALAVQKEASVADV